MWRKRRLRTAMDSLQEYTLRKLIEHKNSSIIKATRVKNQKKLAMRALDKFVTKAKQIKGDPIQEKLLDSEAVIIDEDNNFVVVEHSKSIDFVPVAALQVSTLVMSVAAARPQRDYDFGNALNCK